VFVRLILVCLLWAGLHFYFLSRLLSIPFIAHYVPARLLIPVVILLGASYIVSRVLEHYSIDGLSHVLEIVGAYSPSISSPASACGCVRSYLRYAQQRLSSRC